MKSRSKQKGLTIEKIQKYIVSFRAWQNYYDMSLKQPRTKSDGRIIYKLYLIARVLVVHYVLHGKSIPILKDRPYRKLYVAN